METITNVTNAAVKAVWGTSETKQEPVSGLQGNTAKGEPYDTGNLEPQSVHNDVTTPRALPDDNEKQLQDAKNTLGAGADTNASTDIGKPELADAKPEHINKPVAADSSVGGQHDTRDPKGSLEDDPVPNVDLSKPGPKPLETVAKEHGGDAGNISKDTPQPGTSSTKAVAANDTSDGPQSESHGTGTGEKHIKTTGFAAEGGDFDAANAGAAIEADRLVKEGGHPGPSSPGTGLGHTDSKDSSGSGEKKSLKERIKAKLHKH
ncbi:hypothetical protein BN1723_011110 [Verticillium longisporum]|uniref:Uncharacterized protein n=1 Tax=Verticillium longisporum TaxID=100787 RepID=A0A0G4L537_VERLO|nr:hypothetical protein HYQ44_000264 [Verticillium longisporum]CRK16830.1 hypothetical protein BN1723_011110 [Verticillium longisporum]